MKNKIYFRICSFLLAMLCILLTAVLPAAATKDSAEAPEGAREWELSSDGKTLTSDFEIYYLYVLPVGYYLDYHTYYGYANSTNMYSRVASYARDGGFVWIEKNSPTLYATKDAAKDLDAFLEGEASKYRLADAEYGDTSLLTAQTFASLEALASAGKNKKTTEVSALRDAERYDLTAHDKTDTVATVYGAIYVIDDTYYYLGYRELGNQFFDADGNFSYRSGSVSLVPLDSQLSETLSQVIDGLDYERVTYAYEDGEAGNELEGGLETVSAFWCAAVFFGLLLPIVPLVMGLVLPHSKKRGYPKYWYALAIAAGLWIFFAIVFMLVVALG